MATEIHAIEQVTSTALDVQQVQGIDLVHPAVGDLNERGNRAAYASRKNKVGLVHGGALREDARDHESWSRLSNRNQTEMPKNRGESLTYVALM